VAEDVVQQLWAEMVKPTLGRRFDPARSGRRYLLGVLRNVLRSEIRKLRRSQFRSIDDVDPAALEVATAATAVHDEALDRLEPGRAFSCSLGTKYPKVAQDSRAAAEAFIRQALADRSPLTAGAVQAFCRDIARVNAAATLSPRVNRSRAGPVIIYRPATGGEPEGTPEEAMRVYTVLLGTPESGYNLRVNVVGPNGRGTDRIHSLSCSVLAERKLTLAGADPASGGRPRVLLP
jgi:hypothetical protein